MLPGIQAVEIAEAVGAKEHRLAIQDKVRGPVSWSRALQAGGRARTRGDAVAATPAHWDCAGGVSNRCSMALA